MTIEPELLSVVLTVTPALTPNPSPVLEERQIRGGENGYGRAAHAVLLDAVREHDPALAESLHAGSGLRPFTVSDLIGYSPKRGPSARSGQGPSARSGQSLEAGRKYSLRFTAMTGPVAQAIRWAVSSGQLAVGSAIRLTESEFVVEAVDSGLQGLNGGSQLDDPKSKIENSKSRWPAAATYESLSAPWLLGRAQPGHRLALQFASPTTFKSQEKHVPVPLPAWVFGSLLEKWNAFAPVALPPEARRFAEECLALSGYKLQTRPVPTKEGGLRMGAVGVAYYTAINRDRYWLSVMNLLADFALFAGIGAGTTMGLGQCRRLEVGS
ncbi:MAG: CRISPR-associated endoribonuclease Cas6 [Chloroflexi bacterium]|nr:CRISPR-associated endoribonuclease Cas6 [Chloroflexota bacterium]